MRKPRAADSFSTSRALTLAGIALIAIAAYGASRRISIPHPPDADASRVTSATPALLPAISIAGAGGGRSAPSPPTAKPDRNSAATTGRVGTSPAARGSAERAAAAPRPIQTAAEHARAEDDASPTVTIAGCVDRDRNAFWLRSVSGDDVPRTRSWKSGFFRKRASSITLTDATDGVGLDGYVGQRIAATGRIVNGELRASSLQQLAESCKGS